MYNRSRVHYNRIDRPQRDESFEEFLLRRQKFRDESNKTIWPKESLFDEHYKSEHKSKHRSVKKDLERDHDNSFDDKCSENSDQSLRNTPIAGSKVKSKHKHKSSKERCSVRHHHKSSKKEKHHEDHRHRHKHSKKRHSSSKSHRRHRSKDVEHSNSRTDIMESSNSDEPASITSEKTQIQKVYAGTSSPKNLYTSEPNSDVVIGPVPLKILEDKPTERTYGGALLAGEGIAMAAYIQSGKRIPRRGEIGLTSEEIKSFEDVGFVMSGSRHRRMNAVRLRKENQVISAEEKRALLILNREANIKKENEIIANLKDMVQEKLRRKIHQD